MMESRKFNGGKRSSFMVRGAFSALCLSMLILGTTGCDPGGPAPIDPKAVVPIKGVIHLDGVPTEKISVILHPRDLGENGRNDTPSRGITNADGEFAITTYYQDDGAPIGEYTLTFKQELLTHLKPAPDELYGKYANPATSNHTVAVKGDEGEEGIDLELIELERP